MAIETTFYFDTMYHIVDMENKHIGTPRTYAPEGFRRSLEDGLERDVRGNDTRLNLRTCTAIRDYLKAETGNDFIAYGKRDALTDKCLERYGVAAAWEPSDETCWIVIIRTPHGPLEFAPCE